MIMFNSPNEGRFRFWCQKVLPLIYDDSLSYYELLAKVVVYLNNVIEDIGKIPDYVAQELSKVADTTIDTADELITLAPESGTFLNTRGFHSIGDTGACLYKITNDYNDIINAPFYLTLASENLWAIPIINSSVVTPEMFGAYGDGTHDDTNAIKFAIAIGKRIRLNKDYLVDTTPANCITIDSDNKYLDGCGRLIAKTTNLDINNVLRISNANNVTVEGLTFVGDISNNTSVTEGAAHCINIRDSKNINLLNIKTLNAYTDGIYIIAGENIYGNNIYIDRCGRNGCSITNGKTIHFENVIIKNIYNHAPQSGIGIEPNFDSDNVLDISFENVYIENCRGYGFYVNVNKIVNEKIIGVSFKNMNVKTCNNIGLTANENCGAKGNIIIDNFTIDDFTFGVFDYRVAKASNVKCYITNGICKTFNKNGASITYGCFISYNAVQYVVGNYIVDNIKFEELTQYCQIYTITGEGIVGDGDFTSLNSFNTKYYGKYPYAVEESDEVTISNYFAVIKRSSNTSVRAGRKQGELEVFGNSCVIGFISGELTDGTTTGNGLVFTGAGYAKLKYYDTNKAYVTELINCSIT